MRKVILKIIIFAAFVSACSARSPMTEAEECFRRGEEYLENEGFEQAIAEFDRAIELDGDYAEAYNGRGEAYTGLKKFNEAIDNYSKAIEIAPEFVEAYINRGNLYAYVAWIDQAMADFDRALEIDPQNAPAYYFRGNVTRRPGGGYDFVQMIADYTRAIEIDPQYFDAYIARGNAYHSIQKHELAIADFSEAIALDPESAVAYLYRSEAQLWMGEKQKAAEDLEKALELGASTEIPLVEWLMRELETESPPTPPPPTEASDRTIIVHRRDAIITIDPFGDVWFQETWEVEFVSGPFTYAFRNIPTREGEMISLWQILESGVEYQRATEHSLPNSFVLEVDGTENLVTWYYPETSNRTRSFTLIYKISGSLGIYEDYDVFSWIFIETDRGYPIWESNVVINLPHGFEPGMVEAISVHNNHASDGTVLDKETVSFSGGPFEAGDYWKIEVNLPHGYIQATPPPWQE